MKKLSILFIIASFFLVSSCSKDDDNSGEGDNSTSSATISGDWNLTSLNYSGESQVDFDGVKLTIDFQGIGSEFKCKVNFGESPNKITSEGGYLLTLKTKIDGEPMADQVQTVDSFEVIGDWKQEGDYLHVDQVEGEAIKLKIETLTASVLRLTGNIEDVVKDENGNDVPVKMSYDYSFSR